MEKDKSKHNVLRMIGAAIILILFVIFAFNFGFMHGVFQTINGAMKYEDICNKGANTEYINDTCYIGEGNYSYKVNNNERVIVSSNYKKTFKDDIYVFITSGMSLDEN